MRGERKNVNTATDEPPLSVPDNRNSAKLRFLGFALAISLLAAAYVTLTLFIAPQFRGSDQYWYVEDTTTLLEGGPAESHETYPYFIAGFDDRFSEQRSFVHNTPALLVWAGAARLVGDVHRGILLVNILCGLASAALVYSSARRFTGRWGALAASAFTLFIPIGFWVTSQAMAEAAAGVLVAAALWLVVREPTKLWSHMAAVLLVALAAAGRIWVLPYALLFPLALLYLDNERLVFHRVLRTAGASAFGLTAFAALSRIFVNYIPPLSLMETLDVSTTNNMVMFYRLEPAPALDVRILLGKLLRNTIAALRAQFSLTARVYPVTVAYPWVDRLPVNLAAMAALGGFFAFRTDRRRRYVMGLGFSALLMHIGMAVIFLNQPRYVIAMIAPLALGATVAIDSAAKVLEARPIGRRILLALVAASLAAMLLVDVHNARVYRQDALRSAQIREEMDTALEGIVPKGARVALDTRFSSRWAVDHALYPREVLALATDFPYDKQTYESLIGKFGAEYLVVDGYSALPELLDVEYAGNAQGYAIYRIRR